MRFSVIICTLGRPEILRETLASVCATNPGPHELLVVDGDPARSAENVAESFRNSGFNLRYLNSAPGLPRQRNRGIDAAQGDVVVFFDDDVRVPGDIFTSLERVYADDDVIAATGRIVEPAERRIGRKHSPARRFLPGGGGSDGSFTRFGYPCRLIDLTAERDISFMHGSFMSVRRTVAQDVRFDERLGGYALAEDEDFSYRVSRRGRIRFVPSIEVRHEKAGHGSRDARGFGRQVVVNRWYLFNKNFDVTPRAKAGFAMLIGLFVAHRCINREWDEARGLLEGAAAVLRGRGIPPREPPPKILFVSSHSKEGGSERYLEVLIDRLGDEWFAGAVTLEHGPLVEHLRAHGRPVSVIATGAGARDILAAARALRVHLREHEPDVLHANGVKAALIAILAAGRRVPVVWLKHDFGWDGLLARFIAARTRLIVGVSRAVTETFGSRAAKRVRVVHTGVAFPETSTTTGRALLLQAADIPAGALLVGLVGRLHPVKGHLDLIDVTAPLFERVPATHLCFIGGDDASYPGYRSVLEARAQEAGVADRIHFLGHRSDLPDLLGGLNVAVIPSGPHPGAEGRREGFPISAIEIMHAGVPIVGYRDGGLPELVGECGRLVEPGDKRALLDALVELLRDEDLRAELGNCGRSRAHREFSLEAWIEGLRRAYLEAVA